MEKIKEIIKAGRTIRAGIVKSSVLLLLLAGILVWSCKEDYDKHYEADPSLVEAETLVELIDKQPELTTFAALLRKSGIDAVLVKDQSYTVWAPVNDALAHVNVNDEKQALQLVKNHIARFTLSASGSPDKSVYMLNAKWIPFTRSGSGYRLGESELLKMNKVAKNGILHTLSREVPFVGNLWESINDEEMDSIRHYLYGFNKEEFIPWRSTPVDIDSEGRTVYDSIFDLSNIMWSTWDRGIGYLNNEDSAYTMIQPTNQAWRDAYERIKPYFRSSSLSGDSLQHINTQYTIVQDLVFRNPPGNPAWSSLDSMISTQAGIFYEPDYLLEGAEKIAASNGTIYRLDRLNHKSWESWHRTIRIEAEYPIGRENDTRSTIQTYAAMDHPEISDYRFIAALPMATADRPYVQFELPKVLAAAYNIYCVFVPNVVIDPKAKEEMTRVRFTIYNYRDDRWISIASGGNQGGAITPADNTTSPTELKKMLVYSNFVFPYANYNEQENTLRIRVTCSVTASEINRGYSNSMRIDCILLEPVH